MISTLFIKGKMGDEENNMYTLKIARKPTFISVVEIRALMGGGATECASIVTVCIGNRPILVLNPITTNTKAILRYRGLAWLMIPASDSNERLAASSLP